MKRCCLAVLVTVWISFVAPLSMAQNLVCHVDGSDDQFLVYSEQQILRSELYDVYALMGGMTLLTVARASGRFHRITQLNLQPFPEPVQRFEGSCYNAGLKPPRKQPDKHS